jgi:hypothetical protein
LRPASRAESAGADGTGRSGSCESHNLREGAPRSPLRSPACGLIGPSAEKCRKFSFFSSRLSSQPWWSVCLRVFSLDALLVRPRQLGSDLIAQPLLVPAMSIAGTLPQLISPRQNDSTLDMTRGTGERQDPTAKSSNRRSSSFRRRQSPKPEVVRAVCVRGIMTVRPPPCCLGTRKCSPGAKRAFARDQGTRPFLQTDL